VCNSILCFPSGSALEALGDNFGDTKQPKGHAKFDCNVQNCSVCATKSNALKEMAKQLSGHKTRMQVLGRSWKYPREGQKYCGFKNMKKSYLKIF